MPSSIVLSNGAPSVLDLRPLLFVNYLALLLLVTAGVVRFAGNPATAAIAEPNARTADTRPTENGPTLADLAPGQADKSPSLEEAILFVDQLPDSEQEVPAPTLAVASIPGTSSQRLAEKVVQEPPPPPPEPEPVLPTTGKLSVRSNVANDQVYINGKAQGSSGKTLELAAGEYEIQVQKQGYRPWRSVIDLARGDQRTLVVTLERITRVEFRDGKWLNGVVTGTGTYSGEDGLRYEGEFLDRKFHGKGRLVTADGLVYEGEWFNGNKHGTGTLQRPNGDVYVGEFRDDQFNGQGTLTLSQGDIYSGYWIGGVLNGDGSLTKRDGTLYTGGFADGQFQGQGSITYADGSYYEGSFANGQYQGKGELSFADGKKYIGNFLEGKFHGQGEWLNPNGSKISGNFKFGKPFGVATLTTAEGEVFTARSDNPGVCYRLKSYRATQCPVLEGW